jgi:hypothetical protein
MATAEDYISGCFSWNETVEISVSTGQSMEKYNGKDDN